MQVVAIVQAKGENQRLPNKHLANLHGDPLVVKCLEQVFKSKYVDEVILSTDSSAIISESVKHFHSNFHAIERPDWLNETAWLHKGLKAPNLDHAINWWKGESKDKDIFWILIGGNTIVQPRLIDAISLELRTRDRGSIVRPMREAKNEHPWHMFVKSPRGSHLNFYYGTTIRPPVKSQDFEPVWLEQCGVLGGHVSNMDYDKPDNINWPVIANKGECLEVEDEVDLEMVRKLLMY